MVSYNLKLFLILFIFTTFIILSKFYYPNPSTLVHIKKLDKYLIEDKVIQLFKDWKKQNGLVYKDHEEMAKKFVIFISNLDYITESNAKINLPSSHVLSLNKFSDWTQEEFKKTYLNLEIPTNNDIELSAVKNQGSRGFGPSIVEYDYLALSVIWPKGVCINASCIVQPIPNFFLIHGLWPGNLSSNPPRDCNTSYTFPTNEYIEKNWNSSLVTNMKQYWINLHKTNYRRWKLQWKHHGSCANKDANTSLNVEEYFSKTMDAYFKYNVHGVLDPLSKQHVSIIPGKEYSFGTLKDGFKEAFNDSVVTLKCTKIEHAENNTLKEQHLREVLIYMDNDLNKTVVEGEYMKNDCDKNMTVIFTAE